MSGSSALEIDFFRLNDESSPRKKLFERRDIQGVMSKINPELLKTVIASASASASPSPNNRFLTNKSFSSTQQVQSFPVYNSSCGNVNLAKNVVPMTIFYNGTVLVFDVSPNLAENIMKVASSGSSDSKTAAQSPVIGEVVTKDLPLSRKKSLRRFLEKRKERQEAMTPYAYSQGNISSH